MKRALRFVCLMLCLTLLPLSAMGQEEASAPSIRVLLRRLNLTDRADLILDGVYTVSSESADMAFPRGSRVTVQIRSGALYLFYQGMSLRAGSRLTFVRNASEAQDSDGIRFAEGGNFYPGDLSLTVSGGLLQPVCTLSVEDYLLGVVPYEMSNSFPLEALKAQAVCARTYALSHVKPDQSYDVVDTTNDQVFRGVNLSYTNAIRAVQETAGVVGGWKGQLATCFYSASNGGQTDLPENVWGGGGDYGYYAMTDDPFDLENPESIVRRASIPKQGEVPQGLLTAVSQAMADTLRQKGYGTDSDCFRIDSVTAASLGGTGKQAPSRDVTELTLTFTWSGRRVLQTPAPTSADTPEPAARPAQEDAEFYLFATDTPIPLITPAPTGVTAAPTSAPTPQPTPVYSAFEPASEPATVTVKLFPSLIRGLNLSISGTDNEMVTLVEKENAFVLEARRFGHGVGMSQRGAQWMAGQYGKQFHEILDFYYPGMTLMKAPAGETVLPTAPPELAATPAPPATPTPRPTLMPVTTDQLPEGAYVASVEGIEDDSSLNLRAEPHAAADILMRLYKHQQLIVLGVCEDPAWVHVKTDAAEGYVMASFLETSAQP